MTRRVRKGIKPLRELRKELPSRVVGEVASLRGMGRKGRRFLGAGKNRSGETKP